jgi:LysR family transcriptional regulator for bpeEF and oprC
VVIKSASSGISTSRAVDPPMAIRRWPIRIDLQVADKPSDLIGGNIDCAIRGGPMEDSTLIYPARWS